MTKHLTDANGYTCRQCGHVEYTAEAKLVEFGVNIAAPIECRECFDDPDAADAYDTQPAVVTPCTLKRCTDPLHSFEHGAHIEPATADT